MPDNQQQLDARTLPPYKKHATIFQTYDALKAGEAFVLVNDHDPKPLRYQLAAIRGQDRFSWEYLEQGPEVWKIRIAKKS